jgi:hypothetical protein
MALASSAEPTPDDREVLRDDTVIAGNTLIWIKQSLVWGITLAVLLTAARKAKAWSDVPRSCG